MVSFGEIISALINALEGLRLSSYVDTASMALLVYDYLLTFEDERTLMWPKRWSPTKVLFLTTRYLPFVDLIITASHHFRHGMTPGACWLAYQSAGWLIDIGILTSEFILLIRTWAIWGTSWRIAVVLGVWASLSLIADFVVMGLFMTSIGFTALPEGMSGCLVTSGNSLIMGVWIILMIYESGIILLMILKGIELYREHEGSPSALLQAIFKDGAIFYVYIFALSVANVIAVSRLSRDLSTMLASIERVLHAILTQRLLFTLGRAVSEPELDDSEKLESMEFNDGPRPVGTIDTEAGTGTTLSSLNFR